MKSLRSICYNIKNGVRNLVVWLPIIWRDRDWDHNYLMLILEKKLCNMSMLHEKHGYAVNSKEISDELKEASILAGRIAREDYTDEAFGNKKYLLDKNEMVLVPAEGEDYNRIEFVGLTPEEYEEMRRLHNLEDELMEKDIEKLFELMKINLRNWWD